jgi:Carboxypeptidase regulatory-like domain
VTVENPLPILRWVVQLKLVESGTPLREAGVDLYLGKPSPLNDLPYETLTTNSEGVASTSELTVATYYLRTRTRDHRMVEFVLNIPLEMMARTSRDGLELEALPREVPQEGTSSMALAPAEGANSLETDLQTFHGVVMDPATAVIPKTEIVVYKTDDPKHVISELTTDDAGQFSAKLVPGKYLVTFYTPGFVRQRVLVSVGESGWRGLQLNLAIASCPGMARSTIVEMR